MKSYEIRIGSIDDNQTENPTVVVYNDRRYNRLSDAAAALQGILDLMASDKDLVDDDLCFWIIRNGSTPKSARKKGKNPVETEVVQVVCGNDEDSGEFCYEGMYFLTNCSDFEKMILLGGNENAWIGDYGVRIESGNQAELCFYSDLDMILESIRELGKTPQNIVNRLMTLLRRDENGHAQSIGQLLYGLDGNRNLVLRTRIDIQDGSDDQKQLEGFLESLRSGAAEPQKAQSEATAEETDAQPAEEAAKETASSAQSELTQEAEETGQN